MGEEVKWRQKAIETLAHVVMNSRSMHELEDAGEEVSSVTQVVSQLKQVVQN